MKNIITTCFLLVTILMVSSCSEDDKPTKEETFLADLSGTWQADAVMLDDLDVTEEFEDMAITFKKDKTFTVQNSVGNIWGESGTFTLEEGSGSNFNLLRNDDTLITVTELTETTLTLTMQFDSAPGRTRGLAGEYVFEMKR
jgi:Lipocalin-like domain